LQIPALPVSCTNHATEEPGVWEETNGKVAYTIGNMINAGNVESEATEWTMEFYRAYEERWGLPPEGYGTSSSYMAIYILKDAIERAGTVDDADALVEALEETDLMGVYGRIRFDPERHQVIPSLDPEGGAVTAIYQWQDGARVCVFPPQVAVGEVMLPPYLMD
jgi:branched-chain amino acid transport system substrate-binding protein